MSIIGNVLRQIRSRFFARTPARPAFAGSANYWEARYASGGHSGAGSYGDFAAFKAEVINRFVVERGIRTVIDFGCGDGNQLELARYPAYLGFDVSSSAVAQCRERFRSDPTKAFRLMSEYRNEQADLALSLDVIYHLVEDEVFENYMHTLFGAASRFVIIYASDSDDNRGYDGTHIRHRQFSRWVHEHLRQWHLLARIPNRYPYHGDYRTGSWADFYIYERS